MSRVEDDRDAARLAERIAQQKRAEEAKKREKVDQDSAFARLVGGAKAQEKQAQGQRAAQAQVAKSAIAALLDQANAERTAEGSDLERRAAGEQATARANAGSAQARQQSASVGESHRQEEFHAQEANAEGQASAGRAGDAANASHEAMGRKSDARGTRENLDKRHGGSSQQQAAGGKGAEKGALKTDADKGGQGQQGGKNESKGGDAGAAGLRFNPALMAPPPVAQKRDLAGSDRLRRIATEIAQKIVERVRVGTNQAGKMEFQIDLRSDVLSGLQVKVSSSGGRIKATFSGRDKEVLKLLEQQSEALKKALAGRGLTLEDLVIEAKA